VPAIGYERAREVVVEAHRSGRAIAEVVVADGLLTAEQFEELLSAEAVCRLGTPQQLGRGVED